MNENECGFCSDRTVYFDRHLSLFSLDSNWLQLLKRWKFENDRTLYKVFLPTLNDLIKSGYLDLFSGMGSEDCRIGFIRSGKSGYESRAYSPCRDILHWITKTTGAFSCNAIAKRSGFKQSKQDYAERFISIREKFYLNKRFSNRAFSTYIILEDVFTTGATANEAARLLKNSGVKTVYILSMLMRD